MARKNDAEIAAYIRLVKRRMTGSIFDMYRQKRPRKPQECFYLNGVPVTRKELKEYEGRVREILTSDEVIINPLYRIITYKAEFRALDDVKRERFILEISKIYRYCKKVLEEG